MKREDIKPCIVCDKGVAHDNNLMFFKVKITRFVIDARAIQSQAGLETMLGSASLAQVMGPDEDLAIEVGEGDEALISMSCIGTRIDEIMGNVSDKEK